MNKTAIQIGLILAISVVYAQQKINPKEAALHQKEQQLRTLKNNSKKKNNKRRLHIIWETLFINQNNLAKHNRFINKRLFLLKQK